MEKEDYNSLDKIAKKLRDSKKKTKLLYAFNGTGKTRLSMSFKDLVNPPSELSEKKQVIYYNAFTEDLFNWENDLESDLERVLKLNTNSMFVELMKNQGKELEIINKFQKFSSTKIEPNINYSSGEIRFRLATGDDRYADNIKISRGEERIFIWAMFYTLMETIIAELNYSDKDERSTDAFDDLNYIFIDDPISSLDDNHAIDVALDLIKLIKKSKNENLYFIISTHHSLFYNVLHNELKNAEKYLLRKSNEGYSVEKIGRNSPFGYHLLLKEEIKNAIETHTVKRYHFNLLRNLLEKSAHFLGYQNWTDLINEDEKEPYIRRINLYSHSDHSAEEARELEQHEVSFLIHVYQKFLRDFNWKE